MPSSRSVVSRLRTRLRRPAFCTPRLAASCHGWSAAMLPGRDDPAAAAQVRPGGLHEREQRRDAHPYVGEQLVGRQRQRVLVGERARVEVQDVEVPGVAAEPVDGCAKRLASVMSRAVHPAVTPSACSCSPSAASLLSSRDDQRDVVPLPAEASRHRTPRGRARRRPPPARDCSWRDTSGAGPGCRRA